MDRMYVGQASSISPASSALGDWIRELTIPHWYVCVPYWFLVLLSVADLPSHPWLRWRFSLRTLLIATTLVAVVLGIIVWMSRAG